MSRYNGTVTVTNGSVTVTGIGTSFIGNIFAGHDFKMDSGTENVSYLVAADAVSDTELVLAAPYAGVSRTASCTIQRDYTSLGLSEIGPNDADWAYRLTQGVIRKVDALISGLLEGYAVVGGWNAATNSPTIPTAVGNSGKRYIVTTAGATLIDGAGPWGVGDSACSNGTVYFRVPAAVAISAANVAELTGLANSILHFHATDRDLANATGSLAAAMIAQDATHRMLTDAKIATYDGFIEGRTYKGLWDADTNTPATPAADPENNGWYYRTSVAGNGYSVGDVKISNGTTWERIASADAPAIHGADHIPGGIDPIPLATLTTPGLMDLTTFKLMLDQYLMISEALPINLPVGSIWIDSSTTVRFAPSIAAILSQAWLYASGATIAVFIDDVQDVDACTLTVLSSNSEDMPTTGMTLTGTGAVRSLVIDAIASPASSVLTLIVTNAYGLTSQITFQAVAAAQMFTITTSTGPNGTITATQTVAQGDSITISTVPSDGYSALLSIDGGAPTAAPFWTFNDVQADHTVAATFAVEAAPTVNAFTVGTLSDLTVAIATFTDTGAAYYLIAESATPPLAGAAGWSASKPTSYTAAAAGTKTLYPWVKTAGGTISAVFASPRTVVFGVYVDDFNRANGAIGDAYALVYGTMPAITDNKLIRSNLVGDSFVTNKTVLSNNQFAEITGIALTGDGTGVGVQVRGSLTTLYSYSLHLEYISSAYSIVLYKRAASTVAVYTGAAAAGITGIRLEIIGNTLTIKKQIAGVWSDVTTYTDSASPHTSGYAGVRLHCGLASTSAALDNFTFGGL